MKTITISDLTWQHDFTVLKLVDHKLKKDITKVGGAQIL